MTLFKIIGAIIALLAIIFLLPHSIVNLVKAYKENNKKNMYYQVLWILLTLYLLFNVLDDWCGIIETM
jgi:hypothetical protein